MDAWLKLAELAVTLITGLAWPALLLAVLFVFRARIAAAIGQITKLEYRDLKIERTLSSEIERVATKATLPDLGREITRLSRNAIRYLLERSRGIERYVGGNPESGHFFVPAGDKLEAMEELHAKGLLKFREPRADFEALLKQLPIDQIGPPVGTIYPTSVSYKITRPLTQDELRKLLAQGVQLTDKGKHAADVIIEVVAEQLTTGKKGVHNNGMLWTAAVETDDE